MSLPDFGKISRYLTHPLVLIGFVFMLIFGIHETLISSGLLSQVDSSGSGEIIKLFLHYGFWLGLILAVLGFGLAFWKSWIEKKKP
ncbi:MAG: hypothetical protein QTN59_18865 [Candidatus Electrothrix communis]|nr:MAG: hypothetical protein QTN59_18865 [Candidatus Electrothrix communis]